MLVALSQNQFDSHWYQVIWLVKLLKHHRNPNHYKNHLFLVKKEKTIKYNSMAIGLKSIGRNLCKYIKITPNIYKKGGIKFKL